MKKPVLKQFPVLLTDEEAEDFVANADLSEYDFSGFKRVHFEFAPRTESASPEVPQRSDAKSSAEVIAPGARRQPK